MLYRRIAQVVLSVVVLGSGYANADQSTNPPVPDAAETTLPELPKPPPRAPRTPNPKELAALDDLLSELRSNDPKARNQARAAIDRVDESLIPAIAERLRRIADAANKQSMKDILERLVRERHDKARASDEQAQSSTHDYLEELLTQPTPENDSWKNLVAVCAMSRMLVGVGTVEAGRELIGVYVRFGEFLRIDTQLQLQKLGDRAIAPLIEATQHQAPKIADWAKRRLELMGKDNPADVVQIDTPGVLGDVLRAYGSTRDPDVARLIISFTNSEHAEVRRAARQAVSLLGEVANWPLRDTYEKLTGKRAFREWSWERCARELFREFDHARLANVYLTYKAGIEAQRAGKLDEMRQRFDEVLAQDPGFENANEMALGYFEYAKGNPTPENAIAALERAKRLADDKALQDKIESLRLTLDGERLLTHGIADQILFRRALLLDAENQNAKDDLQRIESTATGTPSAKRRYAAAGVIALLTLIAAIFLLKPPAKRSETPTPPKESAES